MFKRHLGIYSTIFLVALHGTLLAGCATATTEPVVVPPEPTAEPVTEPTAEPVTEPTAEPLKIALVVSSELEDGSWNQFQYESFEVVKGMSGYEVAYSENVAIPDLERVVADYCRQGYDLVMAHSFDYQEPALKVAESCPDTLIAGQGFWEFRDNVVGITVWPSEPAYLAGVLGALMTKTGKLGLIGAFAYAPTQVAHHEGFKAGARSINPDIKISESWTGTWYDVALGYEAATAMFEGGVDFISISLSGPGIGAINAGKDHNAMGGDKVYVVGAFVDMNSLAPDTVITSTLWLTTEPTLHLLDLLQRGEIEAMNYEFFMADGAADIAPYHGFENEIPQEVRDTVAQVRQDIIDGTVVVPLITESPSE